MGMVLSMDEKDAPWVRTSSRSRECSRSIDAIACGGEQLESIGSAGMYGYVGRHRARRLQLGRAMQGRCGERSRGSAVQRGGYNMES